MASRYVTYSECKDKSENIDKKLDEIFGKLNSMGIMLNTLETKFNQELKETISKQQNVSKWKLAIFMAIVSGTISFIVSLLLK